MKCPGNFNLSHSFSKDDVPNLALPPIAGTHFNGLFERQDSRRKRP